MYTVHEICLWLSSLYNAGALAIVTVDTPYQFNKLSHSSNHSEVKLETSQLMVKLLELREWQASVCVSSCNRLIALVTVSAGPHTALAACMEPGLAMHQIL